MTPEKAGGEIEPSMLEEPEIQKFVTKRNIQTEDFPLIEGLGQFPRDIIIEHFHNIFNTHREKSMEALRQYSLHLRDKRMEPAYKVFSVLIERYGWATCYNLVRILEERVHAPNLYKWWQQEKRDE